ncbi:MAG: GtrA family protein [Porticoccaceae bacterium]
MSRQFLRFALVGGIGFGVDVTVLYLLLGAGAGLIAGRAGSFLAAATSTWQLNRRYTFTDRPGVAGIRATSRQWLRFVLANAVGGAVNVGIYAALVTQVSQCAELPALAVAAGSVAGLVFNYTVSRLWVF